MGRRKRNDARNKTSNSNIITSLKEYMHTIQAGILNQDLLIKLETHVPTELHNIKRKRQLILTKHV